jgi:16S rRNA (guanine966-N2)-methyltransferase
VFVDRHRKAVETIRGNLVRAKLQGTVRGQDVAAFVARVEPGAFDLVFADPPFALETSDHAHPASLLAGPDLARGVAPDGLFVIELPAEPPPGNAAWALLRSRRYGQAWVAYYRRTPEA